jgi:hypothetical protein
MLDLPVAQRLKMRGKAVVSKSPRNTIKWERKLVPQLFVLLIKFSVFIIFPELPSLNIMGLVMSTKSHMFQQMV